MNVLSVVVCFGRTHYDRTFYVRDVVGLHGVCYKMADRFSCEPFTRWLLRTRLFGSSLCCRRVRLTKRTTTTAMRISTMSPRTPAMTEIKRLRGVSGSSLDVAPG